jgi:cytochrome o ubiquinol oxidase subunit III
MTTPAITHSHHDEDQEIYDRTLFGFWLYIMTDCILFATLFACYAVLHNGTFGGPTSKDIFSLPFVMVETMLLLTSSFTSGLGMLAAHLRERNKVLILFAATFLLGLAFLAMELHEFNQLVQEGNSWQRSAFLSSYFTLVGTHGLHVMVGLLWIAVMLYHVAKRGLTLPTLRRLSCLNMFWHFLDVIWIFIFTIVYLMGV